MKFTHYKPGRAKNIFLAIPVIGRAAKVRGKSYRAARASKYDKASKDKDFSSAGMNIHICGMVFGS